MKVRVLGCYGSSFYKEVRGVCTHYNSSSFQINETVLIDAGTASGPLDFDALAQIRYVFISHAHLDHTHSLPFMAENLFGKIKKPIVIIGTEATIDALKAHLFNNRIWPDFTEIPDTINPILKFEVMKAGVPIEVERLKVTAIYVNHTVPAVGFLVEDGHSAFVYSGDTYSTDEIWDRASRLKTLSAAFIETTFPDRFTELAFISKHLTPKTTYQEFLKIKQKEIPLYLYHMKVPYLDELKKDIAKLKDNRVHLLQDGQVLDF